MAEVRLVNLVKAFGRQIAIKGINLVIEDKSFVALVGPSGCGKSTTLRMIAGLETVSWGDIRIGGEVVNDLPSRSRGVAMVFQSYALYPHMSVRANLSFGLRISGEPRAEIDRRVADAVEVLELGPYLDRRPSQLSGGQRQRVAMGRAMVREPRVFLFDEPLSNLDAKLRHQMRAEIKKLHRRIQNTVVYVTHDQVEAMTMADKIVIMRDGRIEQVGSPAEVFRSPANIFVAGFIGAPQMNFFRGRVGPGGAIFVDRIGEPVLAEPGAFVLPAEGEEVILGLRPEHIVPENHGMVPRRSVCFKATVTMSEALGNETLLTAAFGGVEFVARMADPREVEDGETIEFRIDSDRIHLFDPVTEGTLRRVSN
ncbi:MAG: sn-glycerol-3-phosphate ABC transporter ATP-binding protein UgpC [Rhodobacter sp.]|nr:sn-glycerol-3-phosphate ABC transporter ATP-binding protein UgpC [Rhodobacter sp.]